MQLPRPDRPLLRRRRDRHARDAVEQARSLAGIRLDAGVEGVAHVVNSQDFMLVPGSNRSIAAIALVSVSCTRSSALVLSRQNVLAKARSAGMRLMISGSGLPELVLLT